MFGYSIPESEFGEQRFPRISLSLDRREAVVTLYIINEKRYYSGK